MRKQSLALFLPVSLLASACIARPATPVTPIRSGASATPAITRQASSPTPASDFIEAQPTPFTPFYVTNSVENLVLRANPGYLFEAKTALAPDTRLLVLGRAPGEEWIFVQTPFERTGWVFAQLLDRSADYTTAPLIQPADMQVLRGKVVDESGLPVSGIQFAVVQGISGSPPRNDAVTDTSGIFYAFMPLTASGTWSVSFIAVACTSNTMDENCQCKGGVCGKPDPEVTSVILPTAELMIFLWK